MSLVPPQDLMIKRKNIEDYLERLSVQMVEVKKITTTQSVNIKKLKEVDKEHSAEIKTLQEVNKDDSAKIQTLEASLSDLINVNMRLVAECKVVAKEATKRIPKGDIPSPCTSVLPPPRHLTPL